MHRPACVAVETLPSFSGEVWSAMTVMNPFGVSRLSTCEGKACLSIRKPLQATGGNQMTCKGTSPSPPRRIEVARTRLARYGRYGVRRERTPDSGDVVWSYQTPTLATRYGAR